MECSEAEADGEDMLGLNDGREGGEVVLVLMVELIVISSILRGARTRSK